MQDPSVMVSVKECRYCDCCMSNRPYGISESEVPVCMGCGAEWDPVIVLYPREKVYGTGVN